MSEMHDLRDQLLALNPSERINLLSMIYQRNDFELDPVRRLSRDLQKAAATLTDTEARYLVDSYYIVQEDRKRARSQERALGRAEEPHEIITWFAQQNEVLEAQIIKALDSYTHAHLMGDWIRGIYGMGPVLSAGLLAYVYMGQWCAVCHGHDQAQCQAKQDPKRPPFIRFAPHDYVPQFSCPTVGHIWSYAGWAGDSQKPWEKGKKRPWSQQLKVLCWRIGDVFCKFSTNENCVYGAHYRVRKEREVLKNESGDFAAKAAQRLQRDLAFEKANPGRKAAEKELHEKGRLSAGHLELRARRYAVKLFLAHLHGEWYERVTGEPAPAPYPIAFLGHAHVIKPGQFPNKP